LPKNHIKDKLKKVNQFKISSETDIIELINNLKNTGFNAKRLALACEIYKKMIEDKNCVKFFGLAGAMVPGGMQKIIHDFIEEGFIDILITTGANLTHDIAETLGFHHLQGEMDITQINDVELHEEKINRICIQAMNQKTAFNDILDIIIKEISKIHRQGYQNKH